MGSTRKEKKMVGLWGLYYTPNSYTGVADEDRVLVYSFDTWKLAEEYIKAARLKFPRDTRFPFRVKSGLSSYSDYEIVDHFIAEHNPKIDW